MERFIPKHKSFHLERTIAYEKDICTLTNQAFSLPNYALNFPQVFNPLHKEEVWAYRDHVKEDLLGLVVAKPFYFSIKNTLQLAYGIGSVAVAPSVQKQGLASKMLMEVISSLKKEPIDFIFLFSPSRSLYTSLGFVPVEEARLIHLGSLKTSHAKEIIKNKEDLTFESFLCSSLSLDACIWLKNFMDQTSSREGPILSFLDFKRLMTIPRMRGFITQKNNQIQCLSFFEKGDDFPLCHHGFYSHDLNALKCHIEHLKELSSREHDRPKNTQLFLTLLEFERFKKN